MDNTKYDMIMDLQYIKQLIDLDKDIQARLKEYEKYASFGQTEQQSDVLQNWDNFIDKEIWIFLKRNHDIE